MVVYTEQNAPCVVISETRWRSIARSLHITTRELEIVQHFFQGASEAEVARKLEISSHTVHTHLGRLYRKLHVHGCPGLLLRVFEAYMASDGAPRR